MDYPTGLLVIIDEHSLPASRQSVPEQTQHIRDDHGQQSHLDYIHDGWNGPVVGDLIVSMPVLVERLEEVQQLFFGDEIWRSQPRNTQHFKQKKVSLGLFWLIWKCKPPGEECKCMENEAAIKDISSGNQLETINHVVVLWVWIRSEEVLHNLQEEEYFRVDEQVV